MPVESNTFLVALGKRSAARSSANAPNTVIVAKISVDVRNSNVSVTVSKDTNQPALIVPVTFSEHQIDRQRHRKDHYQKQMGGNFSGRNRMRSRKCIRPATQARSAHTRNGTGRKRSRPQV